MTGTPLDELLILSHYSTIDWLTVAAFFVIALFYFLAPALGYTHSNRLHIVLALGALVVKMGLAFCRIAMIHVQFLDQQPGAWTRARIGAMGNDGFLDNLVLTFLPPAEVGLLILALVFFSLWLFSLERQQLYPEPLSRGGGEGK